MMTSVLERSPTSSPSWIDFCDGAASMGYKAGLSSSEDFGTTRIRWLKRKGVEPTSNRILVNLRNVFAEEFPSNPKVPQTMTVDASLDHPDLSRAEERLEYLAKLDLSDSFEDLKAPSKDTIDEAGVVLRKLAAYGRGKSLPDLGMDSDGFIVLSFHPDRCGMIGSLSIFGDGTYSYCIEMNGESVECGAAPISGPMAQDLQAFMVR